MRIKNPILALALPSVVSNITVPLLSLADTTIMGHLGSGGYIGAIAVSGAIFNLLYWLFAFLRMGTTGVVAQAHGAGDDALARSALRVSMSVALGIALIILIAQKPILDLSLWLLSPDDVVRQKAITYFYICVWGAPAMLSTYVLSGWFIGWQNTRIPMYAAVLQNLSNILLSIVFVYALDLGIVGVALGTVLGLYIGLSYMGIKCLPHLNGKVHVPRQLYARFFSINTDIFLRTACIVAVTLSFTAAGSRQGNSILECNSVLMQLFIFFSYFMDGFANAGEALSGRFYGANDWDGLRCAVRAVFRWALSIAVVFTLLYLYLGTHLVSLITNLSSVRLLSASYLPWVVAIPLLGVSAFVWDGVFIGITYSRGMLLSMVVAAALFFFLWFLLRNIWFNHALWLAFDTYLFTRGLLQWFLFFLFHEKQKMAT